MEYTRDGIKDKLIHDQRWLERGIIALWNHQTLQEQRTNHTIVNNNMGFNGADAMIMSSLARWILSSSRPWGQRLTPKQAVMAGRKMGKYAGQLLRIIDKSITQ